MELISKISKGSRMDQVYIPKNRSGFSIGSYVIIQPLKRKKIIHKPFFYNIKYVEPIKLEIINEIMNIIEKTIENYENVLITGSFLDKGFHFNDIDIVIISEDDPNLAHTKYIIESSLGIKPHIILLNNKSLMEGLSTDPLYQMMIGKCIAKKRFIYKIKPKINYKILDLHLLKSKNLVENFDILTGEQKYYLIRNIVSISLFIKSKKVNKEIVDKEIKKIFPLSNIEEIKHNMLDKNKFLKKYEQLYKKTFDKVMENIKNDSKQK